MMDGWIAGPFTEQFHWTTLVGLMLVLTGVLTYERQVLVEEAQGTINKDKHIQGESTKLLMVEKGMKEGEEEEERIVPLSHAAITIPSLLERIVVGVGPMVPRRDNIEEAVAS